MMRNQTNYQQQLAESLIRSVGIDEAVYFAHQNNWDGVLAYLPKREVRPRSAHNAPRIQVTAALGSRIH